MPTAVNLNSDVLQLQRLNQQYMTKLTEYKSAFASYVTTMKSQTNANSFVVLPSKTFTSPSTTLSDNRNSTLAQCKALCASNKLCTGANFNTISKVCNLRKGDGQIADTLASSHIAIVTKSKQQLDNLDKINSQLIFINNQMIAISNKIKPSVNKNESTLSTNNRNLIKNNDSLLKEQVKIKNMLDQFNDIDQSYINQSLNADQKNARYYLWLVVMIVALILTMKFIFFPDARGNLLSVILWTVIIICIILATINLNSPVAYAIWIMLIALVLMMKANLIPSI
jgi:hypothetical protein